MTWKMVSPTPLTKPNTRIGPTDGSRPKPASARPARISAEYITGPALRWGSRVTITPPVVSPSPIAAVIQPKTRASDSNTCLTGSGRPPNLGPKIAALTSAKPKIVIHSQGIENVKRKPPQTSAKNRSPEGATAGGRLVIRSAPKLMEYDAALKANAGGGPTNATSNPAPSGPTTRAPCRLRARKALAANSVSFGTSSGMIALIAGR